MGNSDCVWRVEAACVDHRKCFEAEEIMRGRFWATLTISVAFSSNYNVLRADLAVVNVVTDL